MNRTNFHRAFKKIFGLVLLTVLVDCGAGSETRLAVVPGGPTEVGLSETLALESNEPAVIWSVLGEPLTGTIDAFGLYRAPDQMPEDPRVIVFAKSGDETFYVWIQLVE